MTDDPDLARREIIQADEVLPPRKVRSYPEERDRLITLTAIGVIGGSAAVSVIGLLLPAVWAFWYPEVALPDYMSPPWPAEMLRLALVASLAFVMGTKAGSDQS